MRSQRPVKPELRSSEQSVMEEKCENPWNGVCESRDVILYIYHKGRRHAICRKCWMDIASSSIEWRYS